MTLGLLYEQQENTKGKIYRCVAPHALQNNTKKSNKCVWFCNQSKEYVK
jgi:hypothetical protein